MSAQTHEEIPSAPASSRAVDKARFKWALFSRDPNPIWIRELRQSARLGRTPIILMVVTVVMTLVIASLGGVISSDQSSDKVGVVVYHTYFSLAFFLVTWLGPAVAANSIASEREGRTWEAVLLTGLPPTVIARGKFLAAMTFISTYIVMLAPVGALAFLFGGVTATEVIIAFGYLFAFALLFVALGLAVSSKMSSLRASILITLLLCVPLSMFCFGALGFGLVDGIHELWRQVPRKLPVWLPTAYIRGDFGPPYVLLLIVMPLVVLGLPTWFLYESTVANLRGANEDRSTGMKRWFITACVVLGGTAIASVAIVTRAGVEPVSITSMVLLSAFLGFTTFVFAGEPVGPSRRVKTEWQRTARGALGRFLGPSAVNAGILQMIVGCVTITAVAVVCTQILRREVGLGTDQTVEGLRRLVAYTLGFYVFLVGFSTWARVRSSTPLVTRIILVVTLAAIAIVPWVIAAIAGVFAHDFDDGALIAAPSPIFAFYMYDEAKRGMVDSSGVTAGMVCIGAWGIAGVGFLGLAARKSYTIISAFDASVAETDRRLALEDAALEAAEQEAREREVLEREAGLDATGLDATALEATGLEGGEPLPDDEPSPDGAS